MSSASLRLCVLFPAHDEAESIAGLVARARAVALPGVDVTLLVVDDGSTDDTGALAERAGATVLRHARNRGVGAAFRTGRDWALAHGFDFLVHLDADGQLLPEELPLVVTPVLRGDADLALGSRFIGKPPPNLGRWKALALAGAARGVALATGYRLSDMSCGFRCMNRHVMQSVRPTFDVDYIQETLIQALAVGARVVAVPVTVYYATSPSRKGLSKRPLRYGSRFLGLTAFALLDFYRRRVFSARKDVA